MTDDQLSYIEAFCAKIRHGLDQADFNTKRQIIELLDIRGKIAFENNEKVLYLKCLISQQQVSRRPISHWRCNLKRTQYLLAVKLVIPTYSGSTTLSAYQNAYASVAMGA